MNYKTFLKKRVYKFLFYKYLPFYKGAKKIKTLNNKKFTLVDIINSLEDDHIENLVLVASGPSSKKLELSDRDLYLCTNNSINLVKNHRFLYYIQDYYFTLKYLKTFSTFKKWKGTFCIVNDDGYQVNKKVFDLVRTYLSKYKRKKNELLISDIDKVSPHLECYNELNDFLKKEFNCTFFNLSSGFSILLLIVFIAEKLNKPIKVYGLDLGFGGNEYFDGKKISEHCSFSDSNQEKTRDFLSKLYANKNFSIENHSFFYPNTL